MSSPRLSVEEILHIMTMYDLEGGAVFNERTLDGPYSERAYVWECLTHLEYDPDYVYQFEDPPMDDDHAPDLYGQAVDRVAAFFKYNQPIIDEDFEHDD